MRDTNVNRHTRGGGRSLTTAMETTTDDDDLSDREAGGAELHFYGNGYNICGLVYVPGEW